MQRNHLFPTILVSLSVAFLSFSAPARNGSVPPAAADSASAAITAATGAASKGFASLYEGLDLSNAGLSREAFDYAIKGYEKLVAEGAVTKDQYLTIVDFSQSGRKKRFYLIDMKNNELLVNTFVSHGKNSGLDMAKKFSNTINSEQSSLGFYVTSATYTGKHGLSLRLQGQEEGFNSNAMARGIVVHGAAYVNSGRVNSDFMGRSQGCPALPEKEYAKVINIIKDGSVMFLYHPSQDYIQNSPVLNS
ncbi:MAG TPA: murein L,D-transpeptidase catalytic domain family protein [Chitinophagaceae bacterium]